MLEQGEILTLEDDKEYVVAATTMFDGFNYVFLIEPAKLSNMMICKFDNVDGLIEEEDPDILEKLLNKFNLELNGPDGLTPESIAEKKRAIREYYEEHPIEENKES